jgi:hypothetical protein
MKVYYTVFRIREGELYEHFGQIWAEFLERVGLQVPGVRMVN